MNQRASFCELISTNGWRQYSRYLLCQPTPFDECLVGSLPSPLSPHAPTLFRGPRRFAVLESGPEVDHGGGEGKGCRCGGLARFVGRERKGGQLGRDRWLRDGAQPKLKQGRFLKISHTLKTKNWSSVNFAHSFLNLVHTVLALSPLESFTCYPFHKGMNLTQENHSKFFLKHPGSPDMSL